MSEPISAVLVGSTGLVGSQILSLLATLPLTTTHVLARRSLQTYPSPPSTSTLTPHISTDPQSWPSTLSTLTHPPSILLSALGTTRSAAGSASAQYAIDHDLNLSLAQSARNAGAKVYVLISTSGADATSRFFYPKMKGELEEKVKELGFPHVVVLRPGLLMGERGESRPAEAVVRGVAKGMKGLLGASRGTDWWAQDAEVVAKAAVRAGLKCVKGESKEGVWILGQGDVVKMGGPEWEGEAEAGKA
ncbi:MAG: Protein fmp52, mitochondrial [Stictis urceolatum]|nr:Protein fmp52, mitochondrial [Stictis urceolata]